MAWEFLYQSELSLNTEQQWIMLYDSMLFVDVLIPTTQQWFALYENELSIAAIAPLGWHQLFVGSLILNSRVGQLGWELLYTSTTLVKIPIPREKPEGASIGGILLVGGAAALAALALKRENA